MNGTFGGGDLISASLAIMLGGGTDAELHEKSVFFTLNMITTSETGIFEYDPQDEPPSGRPPGPWDGYDLFTVDLSTVKDNIEDMLARIAALEDELEQCHDCWEDVVAKLQEYDPDFDPQTREDIVDEIADVYQKGRDDEAEENPPGYKLPDGTDPSDPNIQTIVAGNPLTDNTTGVTIGTETYQNPDNSWGIKPYYAIDGVKTYMSGVSGGTATRVISITDIVLKVTDPTTGDWEGSALVTWDHPWWTPTTFTYNGRNYHLIGYGSTSDTYTVRNS